MHKSLDRILRDYESVPNLTGYSGAQVLYLPELSAYLKIAATGGLSYLDNERDVLNWLQGKIAVPKVLDFEERDGRQFILLSEIAGVNGAAYSGEIRGRNRATDFARMTAAAMRGLHDISIDDCPFDQGIEAKLAIAAENARRGLVDESDFEKVNLGRTAQDVYRELCEKKPQSEDLVFTHGDFCLPNFMVSGGRISGFIDMERGGVADRYQDIALFLRSFAFNIETSGGRTEIERAFCESYGIERLNEEKLYYYRLLDELF